MQNEKADTLKYRARVYTDKALIPQIEEDLRVMVYALIGDKKLEITQDPMVMMSIRLARIA